LLLTIGGCGSQKNPVEKAAEDGAEVVVNGVEPYLLPDVREPTGLDEKFVVDLEDKNVSKIGLYQVDTFAVDTDGNIYILNLRSEENHIFKFTRDGKFEKSFGRHGQGPGEVTHPTQVILTADSRL
jgi:hypothetical protein